MLVKIKFSQELNLREDQLNIPQTDFRFARAQILASIACPLHVNAKM